METIEKDPAVVNGKRYSLWPQFVEKKAEWIGGRLQEISDSFPQLIDGPAPVTTITDITFEPNGKESAMFMVNGKDYGCGFDVEYGGMIAGEPGWITFSGYGGHKWRIAKRETASVSDATESDSASVNPK